MRILIIVPRLLWEGGGDRQVLMLASYLQKEGQKVVIYTAQYAPQQCYPEIGQALDIRVVGTQGNGEDVLKMSRAICDDLKARNEEYDVINCHIHPTQWVSSVMKKQLKIPVVWMSNDMPSWFLEFVRVQDVGVIKYLLNKTIYAAVDRFFVKSVDRIVVLSERERLNIRKYYNRDATVIRSGLKEDYFNKGNREKVRERYGVGNNTKILLCVSLLGPNRRTQDAIEATEVLLKKGKKVKLIVVGGEKHFPGYKEVLRSYAENIRISDHVILAGAIDEIELPDYYAACDIFLYPHINQSWGLAPFEAMAAKRPTIVSLDTGAAEILKDRINSMIVAPMNPELIAEKVIELMENSDLNKNIVANAFAFVRDEISWEKYSREMMKVFEDEVKKDRN